MLTKVWSLQDYKQKELPVKTVSSGSQVNNSDTAAHALELNNYVNEQGIVGTGFLLWEWEFTDKQGRRLE